MDSVITSESPKLRAATSAFVVAAALTVVFNTALACAKDSSPPLKDFMKSLTDHDWTTQGLVDLLIFAGVGFLLMKSRRMAQTNPVHLMGVLVVAVAAAGLGLALWYAVF
jgi:hypothetical protein